MKLTANQIAFNSTLVAIMTALIVVGGIISIPIPVSNVSITLQTLFVLLAGLVFGPWLGALSVLFYLALGAIGLPVFSNGSSGLAVLIGPTAGYLYAFVLAPIIIGMNSYLGKGKSLLFQLLLDTMGALVASIVIYLIGTPVLMAVLGWSLSEALEKGVLPFIPFDLIKLGIAVALASVGRKALKLTKTRFGLEEESA
jgi:biotin transport system substrate-specific component